MKKLITMAVAAALAALIVAGCGGSGGDEYDPWDDYPQYRYLTLYLRVQDPDGDPVRGARVYINNDRVDGLTAGRWYEVGLEGPEEWEGWLHNWAVEDFPVRIDHEGQVRKLRIKVSKPGWDTRYSTVYVRDADPDYMYVRIRFTMGLDTLGTDEPEPDYYRPKAGKAKPAGTAAK